MNNTAGSYALVGAKVPSDSTIAKKLREAGAIILGKTNPSEWGSFRIPWNSSNGWSAYGGQTYGAFYPHQDPSGSSSGSAVAASERMDTIGPLTKTVKDSAYVLQSIVGTDVYDNYTSVIPDNVDKDFVGACKRSALKGARLGVPRNVISLMSDNTTVSTIAAFNATLDILRSAGASVIHTDFPAAQAFLNDTLLALQIMSADFVVNIESYLKRLTYNPHNISTLSSLRNWTRQSLLEGYPGKSTGVWDFALENWNNTTPEFWQAYQKGLYYDGEGGLLGTIKRHGLDAVVLPSKFSWSFAAVAGAPVVSIPMGAMGGGQPVLVDPDGLVGSAPGIPFGFSFLGERWRDARIVGLAYAMEQRTRVRGTVKPIVRPWTELGDVVGME
ncbi:uncharacterized protein J4E79_011048 [Alternaria viburni]|uniref:uncharacterized protein n=1 Tax=Alternaria viburni TaxID=566460 RepID=UPI0020C3A744|nr:uncharacterized protein J4E79_011048 [Alternaria viburni]KAI4644611.1 hypothetical protein J4E79_011048 [Alternaria viburni]